MELLEFMKSISFIEWCRCPYYNVNDVKKAVLEKQSQRLFVTDDVVFVPFYINEGKRYGLYDFELDIFTNMSFEDFIQNKTRKKINEIDIDFIKKVRSVILKLIY